MSDCQSALINAVSLGSAAYQRSVRSERPGRPGCSECVERNGDQIERRRVDDQKREDREGPEKEAVEGTFI